MRAWRAFSFSFSRSRSWSFALETFVIEGVRRGIADLLDTASGMEDSPGEEDVVDSARVLRVVLRAALDMLATDALLARGRLLPLLGAACR